MLRTQRLPEARAAYAQLSQQSPRDYEIWLNLGAINGMLRLFDDSEAAFKTAISVRNDEPRAYFNLARLCELQDRPLEAVAYWQSYLRLKTDDAEAHAQMSKLLHRMKQLPEAEQALRHAMKYNSDNANYSNNLGVILHDLGRYEEALSSYMRSTVILATFTMTAVMMGKPKPVMLPPWK